MFSLSLKSISKSMSPETSCSLQARAMSSLGVHSQCWACAVYETGSQTRFLPEATFRARFPWPWCSCTSAHAGPGWRAPKTGQHPTLITLSVPAVSSHPLVASKCTCTMLCLLSWKVAVGARLGGAQKVSESEGS